MRTPGGPVARARIILLHSIYPVLMHKASFMTVFANTLVGWLRLTVSMLLLFSGLFIILCFSTYIGNFNFHELEDRII